MQRRTIDPGIQGRGVAVLLVAVIVLVLTLAAGSLGEADAGNKSKGQGKGKAKGKGKGKGKGKQKSPGPAPAGFFGASGRSESTRDFETMERVGLGTYRTLFHFRAAKRRRDDFYDWRAFDRLVGEAAEHNVDLLPQLYGSPDWISFDENIPPTGDAQSIAEWQQLLVEIVSRYGPDGLFWKFNPLVPYRPIRSWQIWNEPNDPRFFAPAPNPAEFAKLVKISSAAIRAVDPDAVIVSGGIVAAPTPRGSILGPRFLSRFLRQPGIGEAVDAIGYHPYAGNAAGVMSYLKQARRAIRRSGIGPKPIWVTEVGWSSEIGLGGLFYKDEAGQALALRRTFTAIQRQRDKLNIDQALWYYWRDHFDPFCLWCRSAGMLNGAYREKPALGEFDRLAR